MFIRVNKSSTTFILDGASRSLNSKKKEEMLPGILHNQLRNKIKQALDSNIPTDRENQISRASMEKSKRDKENRFDLSD